MQLAAIPPDVLEREVRAAIEQHLDLELRGAVLREQEKTALELVADLERIGWK